jgi:D-alanine-D-alanine ligase-like ATP-grasp enzyme
MKKYAADLFNAVGAKGYARADFFVEETGRVVFNEMNTIPGFTDISLFTRMMEASGLTLPALIERMVDIACQ